MTAWLVAAFLAGLLVGALLREAVNVARWGHTALMAAHPALRRTLDRATHRWTPRGVFVVLMIVSLLVNAVLGFTLILARYAAEQDRETVRKSDQARADLVRCLQDYNELQGLSLQERDKVTTANYDRQIELLQTTLDSPTRARMATEAYLRQLRKARVERAANPYPPYDLCTNPRAPRR